MTVPSEQKALAVQEKFGDFVLHPAFPVPQPGVGEVLVKIHATALNPADWKVQKLGFIVTEFPAVLGVDIAGEVVKLGEDVSGLVVGDRVFFHGLFENHYAGFQEYTKADVHTLAKIPPNLSYDQAATIPATFDTAFIALYQTFPHGLELKSILEPGGRGAYNGEPILIIGGAGSVGQYAIQLAKLSGFSPIITTASSKHEDYLKSLGATHVLDRKQPLDQAHIKAITDVPLKVVFDAISTEETQKAAIEVVASGGSILLVLQPTSFVEDFAVKRNAKVARVLAGKKNPHHASLLPKVWARVGELVESGDVKPLRFQLLPGGLNGVPAGLKLLEGNQVSGVKLVARPQETVV